MNLKPINQISPAISLSKESGSSQANDEKIKEVANEYEKYFMKEMFKQMRGTVQEGGFLKANNAEKIFQDQLDDQYSVEGNKKGGFGIADLIYNQLKEKFSNQLGAEKKMDQPMGPLAFDKKKINIKTIHQTQDSTTYSLKPDNSNQDNTQVQSPWAGTLQSKKFMDGDQTAYQVQHDNGLESLILIQGAVTEESRFLSKGDRIEQGQTLGRAQKDSPLVWTIKKSVSE